MSGKPDDAQPAETGPSEADAVIDYLRRHPSFLVDNPELVVTLTPPDFQRGEDVIDMQKFMLDSLQRHVIQMTSRERKLLAVAEDRVAGYARVQDAAVAVLGARSFAELVRAINGDLPDLLDVRAARLCFEGEAPAFAVNTPVVSVVPGDLDRLIGKRNAVALIEDSEERGQAVGMGGLDVASLALARLGLGVGAPYAALALGASASDGFNPRQGTDLLAFLAHVVEHCVRRWQSQPN